MKGIKNKVVLTIIRSVAACIWIYATLLLLLPDPKIVFFGLDRLLGMLWGKGPDIQEASPEHLILFFMISFAVGISYLFRNMLITAAVLVAYAFVTEMIQFFIPHRTFQVQDLLQNLIGIAAGIFLAMLLVGSTNFFLGLFRTSPEKEAEPTTSQ